MGLLVLVIKQSNVDCVLIACRLEFGNNPFLTTKIRPMRYHNLPTKFLKAEDRLLVKGRVPMTSKSQTVRCQHAI